MKFSFKRKQKLWQILWLGSAVALALAVSWRVDRPAGCHKDDLAQVTDDTLMLQAQAMQAAQGEETAEVPKRVYLTFDDGPSPTTEKVLDVLKEKGVHATFFVISAPNNIEYLPILQRTVAEGNQVALHSCSHEYGDIYRSPAAFWADIRDLKRNLKPYVSDADSISWIRFPGGSTNTVSHRHGGSHIMKSLKAQAEEKGYHYVDWNVRAEDAAGKHLNADQIYENVTGQVGDKTSCVVLMHDTKATGTTAQALPRIIDWFNEQGFSFCTIDQLLEEQE